MTTMIEARELMKGGHWLARPFLAVGLAVGLLISLLLFLLWGGLRFAGRSVWKGFEPRGLDLARAAAVDEVAQDVEATGLAARVALSRSERLARARVREQEARVSRRQSLRRMPRDQMPIVLDWLDARLDGMVGPGLTRLPETLRASLARIEGDEDEMRTMQTALSYALGVDGFRAAAKIAATDAAAAKNLRSRLAKGGG